MSLVAETRTLSTQQFWENKYSLFILHVLFVLNILTQAREASMYIYVYTQAREALYYE